MNGYLSKMGPTTTVDSDGDGIKDSNDKDALNFSNKVYVINTNTTLSSNKLFNESNRS